MDHQAAVSESIRVDLACRRRAVRQPVGEQPGVDNKSWRKRSGYYEQREGERTGTR